MFIRMGEGLSEMDGAKKRAKFLMSLISDSTGGLRGCPLQVTPCNAIQAYHQFVAITGCLDVNIDVAAAKLQRAVR